VRADLRILICATLERLAVKENCNHAENGGLRERERERERGRVLEKGIPKGQDPQYSMSLNYTVHMLKIVARYVRLSSDKLWSGLSHRALAYIRSMQVVSFSQNVG
jgi:hypothetical protein